MKLQIWDESTAEKELGQRLHQAKEARKKREKRWSRSEAVVFDVNGSNNDSSEVSISTDVNVNMEAEETVGTNYVFKNVRFMHAQMSANPPSVMCRPASSDPRDRQASKAADLIGRASLRTYGFQETSDQRNLNTLIYGIGFVKHLWNPALGELLELDEDTGEFTTEGDVETSVPSVWNIFLDANATCWKNVTYVFERIYIPWEEAKTRWPDRIDFLKQNREQEVQIQKEFWGANKKRVLYDVVTLYEYWEKGLPSNGFQGRFAICGERGEMMEMDVNPERYRPISATYKEHMEKKEKNILPLAKAQLPYTAMTDIDEPNSPWGLSTVEFSANMQENLNRLDSSILEAVRAHGVPRIILPEGSEVSEDSISNSPWDIIKMTGGMPMHYMEPMPLPAAVTNLRESFRMGVDDMQGINESMFGQQSREQSGFSMQYATNQGNMIRQRLFNKYVAVTEELFKRHLVIVANKWDVERTVQTIGTENALLTRSFKGADIMHGYDVVCEFGTSLSLDPMTRRGELMNYMPLLEKAEVPASTILSLMRLGDTETAIDIVELATSRMQEYFDFIIETGMQKEPRKKEDHKNMLLYADKFVMMRAYQDLDDFVKDLIDAHIEMRQALIVQPPAIGGAPGMPAPEGAAPTPPESLGDIPPEILNM